MPYVLLTAAAAILAGVVVVAMGRGGELTMFPRDRPARPPGLAPPPVGGWDSAAVQGTRDWESPPADGDEE